MRWRGRQLGGTLVRVRGRKGRRARMPRRDACIGIRARDNSGLFAKSDVVTCVAVCVMGDDGAEQS
jgi:hypothetical protein